MDAGPADRIGGAEQSSDRPCRGFDDSRPVILFDGVCNLCNATVQWAIDRDPAGRLRFAPLQSEAGRLLLERSGTEREVESLPDSIVLVDQDGIHTRSSAAIRVARTLGAPYSLLGLTVVVPRAVRDALYRFIARRRYRWFGRRDTCMTPTPDLAARFLETDEPGRQEAID